MRLERIVRHNPYGIVSLRAVGEAIQGFKNKKAPLGAFLLFPNVASEVQEI